MTGSTSRNAREGRYVGHICLVIGGWHGWSKAIRSRRLREVASAEAWTELRCRPVAYYIKHNLPYQAKDLGIQP